MAKILKFKKYPICPIQAWGHTGLACRHMGVTVGNVNSIKAFSIYAAIIECHRKFKLKPIEYHILDTNTMLAALPFTSSPNVTMCSRKDLKEALQRVHDRAVTEQIPCFSITVYYNELYDNLFLLLEDMHEQ